MSFGGSVKLTGESEYKRALSQISQGLKEVGAQMKLTSASYDKNDKSTEALTAKSKVLTDKLDLQRKKVETLEKQYNEYSDVVNKNVQRVNGLTKSYEEEKKALEKVGNELGTTSAEYKRQETAVKALEKELKDSIATQNNSEKALSNMRVQLINAQTDCKKTERALNDMGQEVKKTGKETDNASDKFKNIGEVLKNVGKAMAAATAAIGAGAVAAGKKIWDMANETAAAGDTIDKMSQKLGMSAEAYQEWDYVLSQSGADIESMGAGFKSLTNLVDKAISGNDAAAKSFEKLGISTKELSEMSREDIFALTIKRMQEMEEGTERAALANTIFGKSGQNLAPLLNQTAEATQDLKDKAHELGFVMSDEAVEASVNFTDSLDTLKRTFSGVKNAITAEFLPGITSIMDGLSALLAGGDGAKDKIKSGTTEIVQSIKKAIPQATEALKTVFGVIGDISVSLLPDLLGIFQEITTELFTSLSESLPEILTVLFDTLFSLLDTFMTDGLPTLLESLMKVADSLLDSFLEKFPQLINKLINFIGSIDLGELLEQFLGAVEKIAAMIAENLPTIVDNLVKAVVNLIKSIDWKELISSGMNILMSLLDGILSAIPPLIDALPQIIDAIIDFLTDPETVLMLVEGAVKLVFKLIEKLPEIFMHLISAIANIGIKLIEGLWEGISKAGAWLWEKITGFFGGIVDGIKGFFGIHSPSTLFRDQIGKNLALGIGEGFDSEMKAVARDMENAIPTDFNADITANPSFAGFNAYAGAGGAGFPGGNQITQYFNVSIAVDSINDEWDLNDLVTRVSEGIADQVRRTENVYA